MKGFKNQLNFAPILRVGPYDGESAILTSTSNDCRTESSLFQKFMLRFLRGFIKESRDLKAIKRMGRSFMSCCVKLLERNVIKIN